ncbi:hypothetical protein ABIE13_005033 [Ottowia thiooxydans]|uniref:Uncharacterized protein n=1 Tax=Ottowia thiooxydans TaxID=219182 RepID=A0ABV2QFS4_9BURK
MSRALSSSPHGSPTSLTEHPASTYASASYQLVGARKRSGARYYERLSKSWDASSSRLSVYSLDGSMRAASMALWA